LRSARCRRQRRRRDSQRQSHGPARTSFVDIDVVVNRTSKNSTGLHQGAREIGFYTTTSACERGEHSATAIVSIARHEPDGGLMCIGGPGSSGSSATSGFEPRPNIASERERHEIFRGNARYFVQRDEERRQPFYECAHETSERRERDARTKQRTRKGLLLLRSPYSAWFLSLVFLLFALVSRRIALVSE